MPATIEAPATPPPGERTQDEGVAAVDRALSIVAVFQATTDTLTLAELSRRTGFYKSTLLRLLVSLDRFGYVTRVGDRGYRLGPAAFRLGLAYERSYSFADHVLPVLRALVARGTESASFHVRHDAETRICLFRVDSTHPTLDRVRPGDTLPLRRGAPGRLLLACEEAEGDQFAAAIRPYLPTISFGERDPVCAGLAAPVFGPDRRARGVLSLSGPRERFTGEAVQWMSEQVIAAAAGLTRALGGDPALLIERLEELRRNAPANAAGSGK